MTRDAFIAQYQARIAGELILAVRQIIEKLPENSAHAGILGHWMIEVIRTDGKAIAGDMYDLLNTPAPSPNGAVRTQKGTVQK